MNLSSISMDWRKLYFGKVSPNEVKIAVSDVNWQKIRKSMKGKSLYDKYKILLNYYNSEKIKTNNIRLLQVRVTNYITALSRGGLIKPNDYR